MAQRENQYYYFAPDIAEILSVSVPTAYRIIARLNAELEAKRKELEELAGKKNCPSCGAPILKDWS